MWRDTDVTWILFRGEYCETCPLKYLYAIFINSAVCLSCNKMRYLIFLKDICRLLHQSIGFISTSSSTTRTSSKVHVSSISLYIQFYEEKIIVCYWWMLLEIVFFMIKIDFCNKNVKKKIARLDRKIHGFLGVVTDFFNYFFFVLNFEMINSYTMIRRLY